MKRNEIYFVYQNSICHSSGYFLLGLLYQNGRPRDWDFNHTRLISRTWNSGIFPVQCLVSKLRLPYAPVWQEVIRVIVPQFHKLKWAGPCGALEYRSFLCSLFLVLGYILHSASLTSLESQRTGSNSYWSENGGDTETEEDESNGGTTLGQGPCSYSRNMHNNVFEFCRTGGPTQVEDGNFRLSSKFLEHHPVASPPTNLKKVTHPAVLTPNVAFRFWGLVMTILLGLLFCPVYFISDGVQQFQVKLLFLWGWMLVSGTEYLDLDQVERDFCSARQAYIYA